MKHNYKVTDYSKNMVEDFFFLIQNLPVIDKIKLIARISNSILESKSQEKEDQTKEEILTETYGCFESDKSAEEIIDEIYRSRHFKEKNHQLNTIPDGALLA